MQRHQRKYFKNHRLTAFEELKDEAQRAEENKKEYVGVSDEELLTMLANATSTHYGAGGHTKAELNEWAARRHRREMVRRGLAVPDDKELLKLGTFNGRPGSV